MKPKTILRIRFILMIAAGLLLIIPVGFHFYNSNSSRYDPQELGTFPALPKPKNPAPPPPSISSGGLVIGVIGCWNVAHPLDSSEDRSFLNINTPFYVQMRDFDGWFMRLAVKEEFNKLLSPLEDKNKELRQYWKYKISQWTVDHADLQKEPKDIALAQAYLKSLPETTEDKNKNKVPLSKYYEDFGIENKILIENILREARAKIYPVINGIALENFKPVPGHEVIHPHYDPKLSSKSGGTKKDPAEEPNKEEDQDSTYDFYFSGCDGDTASKAILESIAKEFSIWKPVKVTLALKTDNNRNEEAFSLINHPFFEITKSQKPELVIAPLWKFVWLVSVIFLVVVTFIFLTLTTDILKSKDARLRPTGAKQWSLSHFQLAFWFLVIFLSYFYLWVITDNLDQLNPSAVILSGIALATAIAGQSINDINDNSSELSAYNQLMEGRIGMGKKAIIATIEKQMAAAKKIFEDPNTDKKESEIAYQDYLEYERQLRLVDQPRSTRWLVDILSENGEITLHRFQMLAWTLGIGAVFLFHVAGQLKMPNISAELLALMGISAGTYLGFRIPEANRIRQTLLGEDAVRKEALEQDEIKKTKADEEEKIKKEKAEKEDKLKQDRIEKEKNSNLGKTTE